MVEVEVTANYLLSDNVGIFWSFQFHQNVLSKNTSIKKAGPMIKKRNLNFV